MEHTQWKIPQAYAEPSEELENAGYSPLLSAILAARGINSPSDAEKYLSRSEDMLCDPFLLNDMDKAVARIEKAIAVGEKTAVYGDYDVDGITSSCLMADYLRSCGLDCEIYIPDRIDEGYGLNSEAVCALASKGVTLLITVDCGITAVCETEKAKALGIDVIITDHHECPTQLPEAVAVIDPKRRDSTYPNDILAGVGVAFKLICALSGDKCAILSRYCDLAAVGTVADVMPLIGENRVLVYTGLEKLKTSPRPGFEALLSESGCAGKPLSSTTIGFTLAPRINAAGRLCQTSTAIDLLLTEDTEKAKECAEKLCELNHQRQELETVVWDESVKILSENPPEAPIVLSCDTWHPGVVGIAASRLAEEYKLPAVMIHLDGENGKGSCRSYGSFNLFDALAACSKYLEGFGGHAFAAGISIKKDMIAPFRSALAAYYDSHHPTEEPKLEPELLLPDLNMLTMDGVASLDALEPCGGENPRPLLCVCGAVLENVTPIGGGKHLRMRIAKNGVRLDCVFFSHTAESLGIEAGQIADCCFIPQINEFRGTKSVQLLMNDVRSSAVPAICRSIMDDSNSFFDHANLERSQFVGIWRRLVQLGQSFTIPVPEIFTGTQFGVGPVRLCLCLKVFEELGLLSVSMTDKMISVEMSNDAGHTQLDKSPLFRRLCKK